MTTANVKCDNVYHQCLFPRVSCSLYFHPHDFGNHLTSSVQMCKEERKKYEIELQKEGMERSSGREREGEMLISS